MKFLVTNFDIVTIVGSISAALSCLVIEPITITIVSLDCNKML